MLQCIRVNSSATVMMSPSEHELLKLKFLNGLVSLVETSDTATPPQLFDERVTFTVNYDELYKMKSRTSTKTKWKNFIKKRLYDRISTDVENALNIELDVGPFHYTHLFDNLHEKLKLRQAGVKIHESDSHSIRERSERIDAIVRALPVLLKLPDAFCYLSEGKLFNQNPHYHPVYGPIYQRSMDKLFVEYDLGSREDYLTELGL